MKRWPTMPVAPRIPTGSLFDMVSCDFIPAKISAGNAVAAPRTRTCGKCGGLGSRPDLQSHGGVTGVSPGAPPASVDRQAKWRVSMLGSRLAAFLRKRVLVEKAEPAFFGVEAPPAPDDTQTGHHPGREIHDEQPD